MVGHILQYHPAVIKLKKFIASGALGKVEYIYSNRLNIGKLEPKKTSSGALPLTTYQSS